MCAVYSERKSLLQRAVACQRQKPRMLQFEEWGNIKFYQKLGKSTSKMFQMIKQAFSKEALYHSVVISGSTVLHKEAKVWKMTSISVSQEWCKLNSRSKTFQHWCVTTVPKQKMKSRQQKHGLAMVPVMRFCLMT
jgi:hypothetical protein